MSGIKKSNTKYQSDVIVDMLEPVGLDHVDDDVGLVAGVGFADAGGLVGHGGMPFLRGCFVAGKIAASGEAGYPLALF